MRQEWVAEKIKLPDEEEEVKMQSMILGERALCVRETEKRLVRKEYSRSLGLVRCSFPTRAGPFRPNRQKSTSR